MFSGNVQNESNGPIDEQEYLQIAPLLPHVEPEPSFQGNFEHMDIDVAVKQNSKSLSLAKLKRNMKKKLILEEARQLAKERRASLRSQNVMMLRQLRKRKSVVPNVAANNNKSSVRESKKSKPTSKRFRCSQCDRTFVTSHYVLIHEACFHSADPHFSCAICESGFKYVASLNLHIKNQHRKFFVVL